MGDLSVSQEREKMALDVLLTAIAEGSVTPEQAYDAITKKRTMDLDFALVDVERAQRCGHPEAVLGEGKTPEQIAQILESLAMTGDAALATRVSPDAVPFLDETLGCLGGRYHELARCFYIPAAKPSGRQGQIAVVSAGTTDGPVAAEAALTASLLGYEVDRIEDVGVAGLHRLLNQLERLRTAQVIIVVAGMEGALPSVVAGLIDRPVIGVPTSVGYGVSAGGIAALMGMLGSCAAGVTVVNIDNGFGAAYAAGLICGARTARVSS